MLITTVRVKLNERAVLFQDGIPFRALGPGRYRLWRRRLTEQRWNTDELIFSALPEVREIMPASWYSEVTLDIRQRGVLYRDGKPTAFLRPGVHRYWATDPSVELLIYSVDAPMPELTDELMRVIPASEYTAVTVRENQRGLEHVRGKLTRVLEPGRYAVWSYPEAKVDIRIQDMRREQLTITGQDLMTRDKVTLRLSLTAEYAVEDPARAQLVASVSDALYLAVQLAARDYVAGVNLDELLEGRDAMTAFLRDRTVSKAAAIGVRIDGVGIKDIVLPGDMKMLLNKVIEAEKAAAAGVIERREETARTRTLANSAKVIADNPVLLRLKELEAMKDIADRVGEVKLMVGDGGLEKLLGAKLLGGKPN
jgi:regulator of protease activity HflC (stomatin/prohibitin superfamily)